MNETKTTMDWFRFRAQSEPRDILEAMRPMFGTMSESLRLDDFGKGLMGFQQSAKIKAYDLVIGRMDYGGDSQRGWVRVDIPGEGCSWVQRWDAVEEVERLPSAEPRRLDIALTTWKGEVSHEDVVHAHKIGRFTTRGRPPNLEQFLNSDERKGRTCYVGERTAEKFLRAYEKGFEMAGKAKLPENMREGITHIDGFKVEDIYRVELELKVDKNPIPWDVIERRDQYFAGAYPFCADILPNIEPDILQRRPERAPQTDLAMALANVRIQYGATLLTALKAYHGDIGAVWERIVGDKGNRDLEEAGVLLVDHE